MKTIISFGQRLRTARLGTGLSLRGLAQAIDHAVSAQAIGRYERGQMLPGSATALKLAHALEVPLSYLLSPTEIRLEGVEFRRSVTTLARERALVEASVLEHLDRYLLIEDLVEKSARPWVKPPGAPYPVATPADVERVAEQVRSAWALGNGPIPNLTEQFEQRGIKVLKIDFPLSVDGLTCLVARADNEKVPVVVGSTLKSVERQRFSLAHELGHMVMDGTGPIDKERACNRFAGAFLMPESQLLAYLGNRRHAFGHDEIIDIKQLFGVSAMALVHRLADLGVIGSPALRNLLRGIGRSWRKQEPAPLPGGEEPRRFQRLVLRALAEGILTEAKATELLRKNTTEVARLMAGPAE